MKIKLIVRDEGEIHRVDILTNGELVLLDHPDLETDLSLVELGFEPSACMKIALAWDKNPIELLYMLPCSDRQLLWATTMYRWIDAFTPYIMGSLELRSNELLRYKEALSFFNELTFERRCRDASQVVTERYREIFKRQSQFADSYAYYGGPERVLFSLIAEAVRWYLKILHSRGMELVIGDVNSGCQDAAGKIRQKLFEEEHKGDGFTVEELVEAMEFSRNEAARSNILVAIDEISKAHEQIWLL